MTAVFSIETSCDETSVAILKDCGKILSHINYSQLIHNKFGGVVPEIASRAHLQILQKIIPLSFKKAKMTIKDIDMFCATCGPGLIGGLLVGSSIAKTMALAVKKPFYPINHIEAHLLSPMFNNKMRFPNISLVLTGGHTQIYLVKKPEEYELLGETVDDAMGESFDKIAKSLNLNYPGGPEIEKLAKKGNKDFFEIPHPFKFKKNLDFSFSGIKTAINLIIRNKKKINIKFKQNLAASFQNRVIQILEEKIITALNILNTRGFKIQHVSLVGGVATNKQIRKSLLFTCKNKGIKLIYPPAKLCGDNAAMIALTCLVKDKKFFMPNLNFKPNPRLKI